MERTVHVHVRQLVHEQQFDDGWLHAAHGNVKRGHLRIVGQQVGIRLFFKHEKADDFGSHVLDRKVQIGLPDLF